MSTKYEQELLKDAHSVKTLAWKLLMDDDDKPLSSQISGISPEPEDDETSYTFEMLLSILIEMMYHLMIIDTESNNVSEIIITDFSDKITIYLPIIKSKFENIGYIANIMIFNNDDSYVKNIFNDRYCRIILKQNPDELYYFIHKNIEEDYEYILNPKYKKQNKIDDIFALLMFKNAVYKFYFSKIEIDNTTNQQFVDTDQDFSDCTY